MAEGLEETFDELILGDFKYEYRILEGTTEHLKARLVLNNYMYGFHRANKAGTIETWRCRESGCGATIRSLPAKKLACEPKHHKCQARFTIEIEAKFAQVELLKRTTREGESSAQKIHTDELSKFGAKFDTDEDTKQLIAKFFPSFEQLKTAIYNRRTEKGASATHSTDDIDLTGEYTETSDRKRFLLFDTMDQDRIIAFASDVGLEMLVKASQWHADGTFKAAPSVYYQFFTIHAYLGGDLYPCFFVLLKSKTEAIYVRMLELLKSHLKKYCSEQRVKELNFKVLVMDFEQACINAFKLTFNNLTIRGCHFHFCQAIYRKVAESGLKTAYDKNDKVKIWVRSLMALALVPLSRIDDAFELLLSSMPPEADSLCSYFVSTWFEGRYEPALWNHSGQLSVPRTNNGAEGYHSKINNWIQSPHPTIYKLIKTLKLIDYSESILYYSTKNGSESKKKDKKFLKKEREFGNLVSSLNSDTITLKEFLNGACFLVAYHFS